MTQALTVNRMVQFGAAGAGVVVARMIPPIGGFSPTVLDIGLAVLGAFGTVALSGIGRSFALGVGAGATGSLIGRLALGQV